MGELKTWVKVFLFLSSYTPLWIIFLGEILLDKSYYFWRDAISFGSIIYIFIFILALVVFPLSVLCYLVYKLRRRKGHTTIKVRSKTNITGDFAVYAATYVIPFLVSNIVESSNAFALSIMIITIGFLYIRSNMIYINPVLALFGFSLFRISDEDDNKYILLAKRDFNIGDQIATNNLEEQIYIEKIIKS